MKKIIVLITAGLLLSGCADAVNKYNSFKAGIKSIVTIDNLDTIEDAYGAALSVAVGYRDLCERKIINKKCWIVIAKLQPYEDKAYNSVRNLRQFIKTYPNVDAASFVQLARTAIDAFKNVQTQNGVK